MGLNRKMFLYFTVIFVLILGVITLFQYQREKKFREDQLDQLLTTYNIIIDKYISTVDWDYSKLNDLISVFPDTSLRVTIIEKEGTVIFDTSVSEDKQLENHFERPEVQLAYKNGNGKALRFSKTLGMDLYYLATYTDSIFIRTSLPYNLNLKSMLKANTLFLYFMSLIFLIGVLVFYLTSKSISHSINRLKLFTIKADKGEIEDTDIKFPHDELGEISNYIVHLYKRTLKAKDEANNEREKLIQHLQLSQEGLGIFSSEKKELLVNSHFIQYTNTLLGTEINNSEKIFNIKEFDEINRFIDENLEKKRLTQKKLIVRKNAKVFMFRCIVFQDDTFEISINDISLLEQENEIKKELTQNISHELRTPVSSIMGYMETILENPDISPERQRFFIERSFQQSQRLSALLQDISMLNKIEQAERLFDKVECDISSIVDDVLNDIHLQLLQRGVSVVKNIEPQTIIRANRSLLYSIFRNLADNAMAYAGENIVLEINCYREDDQFYYFSFSDNGVGVSESHLSRIFERFYRVDKGRSRKFGGTGLGLAIVKNAVLFHNGSISAKPVPTGGLSFVFSLKK